MCIRALDYCPPFDITFGDYLRALVTADFDSVRNDDRKYRIAIIESFRRWGILPSGLRTLSEEQLRWPFANINDMDGWNALTEAATFLRPGITETLYIEDRATLFEKLRVAREQTHSYLKNAMTDDADKPHRPEFNRITGVTITRSAILEGLSLDSTGFPSFEVHAVRPALRVSPDGSIMKQMIMLITQRRTVFVDPQRPELGTFEFRGGSTLIFDLEGDQASLRYAITRPIDDSQRLADIRAYKLSREELGLSLRETYFRADAQVEGVEPFNFLHQEG